MRNLLLCSLLILLTSAQPPACAQALPAPRPNLAERKSDAPVKRIDVYVTPYYEAARTADAAPHVAVHPQLDALLASGNKDDIARVRDTIRGTPASVTPMTMMALAIRLYDVGLRDDAVFWFYAAKDRYIALSEVLDVKSPALAQVDDAMHAFVSLAGPYFNSYAFCDIGKQQKIAQDAVDWVEKNPYEATFLPQLPAKSGDRAANLKAAIALLRSNAQKEKAYFSDPKTVQDFNAKRAQNNVPAQFCWQ
ncbi:MAG: hypothetical protein J0I77_22595 [Rudaea sp.]|uniref:cytochrome-c oxidase n=1 Tax=unclassified Rudaea TaxID=2627037 RepID=UPI0010F88089|nr:MULTISPECIES: cytochrome-c oxidase [unclassified Rudaea]MBN8888519.1 hypothetical protein [Rudaea sp.]MBR0346246.1 hypothetical protein [Rudaea sp.]